MKITNSNPQNISNFSSRESLLIANSKLIAQLQERLKAKRFRPQEGDSCKLAYMRVFLQALQVQNAILKDQELEDLKKRLEVLEAMQAGSLVEEQDYGSDFESQGPAIGLGNISEFWDQEDLHKPHGASKMVTAAELRRRVEALERGPRTQDTKIFFIEEGEDPALIEAQWAVVNQWRELHPFGYAHVIVFEKVGPRWLLFNALPELLPLLFIPWRFNGLLIN